MTDAIRYTSSMSTSSSDNQNNKTTFKIYECNITNAILNENSLLQLILYKYQCSLMFKPRTASFTLCHFQNGAKMFVRMCCHQVLSKLTPIPVVKTKMQVHLFFQTFGRWKTHPCRGFFQEMFAKRGST